MARTPGSKNKPKDGVTATKISRKMGIDAKIKAATKKVEDLKAKLEKAEKDLKDLEDEKVAAADKIKAAEVAVNSGIPSDKLEELINNYKAEQTNEQA